MCEEDIVFKPPLAAYLITAVIKLSLGTVSTEGRNRWAPDGCRHARVSGNTH